MKLNFEQELALEAIQDFLRYRNSKIFVLKGYAGTGKTTLIRHLLRQLEESGELEQWVPVLLAPTGRAAKMLKEKTGHKAMTLHSFLYALNKVEELGDDDPWQIESTGQLVLLFDVKPRATELEDRRREGRKALFIIDEASMIVYEPYPGKQGSVQFGTGSLLRDFMSVVLPGEKVIFVGDPAQLPPISPSPESVALMPGKLSRIFNTRVMHFELTQIMRQDKDGEIIRIAARLRYDIVNDNCARPFRLPFPKGQQVHLHPDLDDLVDSWLLHQMLKEKSLAQTTMIAYTNRMVKELNDIARSRLFDGGELKKGELLMIVQNAPEHNLVNGDQVFVEAVGRTEFRKVPKLHFVRVVLRPVHDPERRVEAWLIRELLYNSKPNISQEQFRAMLIDFDQRMRARGIRRNSDLYKRMLQSDEWLNALRAKFGYALTVHKAQGGEWERVFMSVEKAVYKMKGVQQYRWFYTAVTRAIQHLHYQDGPWVKN